MPKESQKFYDDCLDMANKFERKTDMAAVHIAIGSMNTNVKGEYKIGGKSFIKALELIQNGGKTLQLATLYQQLGHNLYTRGMYADSIKYLIEAFDIHLYLKTDNTPLAFETFNSLGIVYNAMGNFKEAERYFFESLRRRELKQGKNHFGVGTTKNQIGLMYDLMGERELAYQYYSEGLAIKRKASTPTWSLVYSMNNVAGIYISMKKYSKAIYLLNEAMQKLADEELPHKGAVSLLYDTFGKVYLCQGNYHEASRQFENAVAVRREICTNGVTHVESIMHFAKVQQMLGNNKFAEKLSMKILKLSEATNRAMPLNSFVSGALEVLVDVYTSLGESERVKSTLELLQSELMRQELLLRSLCNTRFADEKAKQLNDIQTSLQRL